MRIIAFLLDPSVMRKILTTSPSGGTAPGERPATGVDR